MLQRCSDFGSDTDGHGHHDINDALYITACNRVSACARFAGGSHSAGESGTPSLMLSYRRMIVLVRASFSTATAISKETEQVCFGSLLKCNGL